MAKKNEKQSGKAKPNAGKQKDVPSKGFSFSQVSVFVAEVKTEFGKIAWPDKKHTVGSTMVVVLLVMVMGLYLGAVDLLLGKLVSFILG